MDLFGDYQGEWKGNSILKALLRFKIVYMLNKGFLVRMLNKIYVKCILTS